MARPIKLFWPASTAVRSVPALISDAAVRTNTKPGRATGTGTSVTVTAPVFRFCRTCFIGRCVVKEPVSWNGSDYPRSRFAESIAAFDLVAAVQHAENAAIYQRN